MQTQNTTAHQRAHRFGRDTERVCYDMMIQSLQKGGPNDLALVLWQLAKGLMHPPTLVISRRGLDELRVVDDRTFDSAVAATQGAHAVEGALAENAGGPSQRLFAGGIKAGGLLPDHRKAILQSLLGFTLIWEELA